MFDDSWLFSCVSRIEKGARGEVSGIGRRVFPENMMGKVFPNVFWSKYARD